MCTVLFSSASDSPRDPAFGGSGGLTQFAAGGVGSVVYAPVRRRDRRKRSKNHFLSIYRPFFSIFSASPNGDLLDKSRLAPLSGTCAPLKNGENGENGDVPRSKPVSSFGVDSAQRRFFLRQTAKSSSDLGSVAG